MIKKNPAKINIIEVGPRDGFQFEKKIIPTRLKSDIIQKLGQSGLSHIQITSFVHPKIVPQMRDAEELVSMLPHKDNLKYSALVLNTKGVLRAYDCRISTVEISISASNTHSLKNSGMPFEKAMEQGIEMIKTAKAYKMDVRAGIQCAFGCAYHDIVSQDRIMNIASKYLEKDIDMLAIADTTGMATPSLIRQIIPPLIEKAGTIPVVLHLHDTRGLGLVNFMTAVECGITYFDTSFGGMGGCPFIPGAAGNIATEDTLNLIESLGIATGIDIKTIAQCSKQMEAFLGKTLPGKIYRLI